MSKKISGTLLSPLFILTAGILWGCMGLLVRSMTPRGFTSMEIVFFRAVVTGVLMLILTFSLKRKELKIRWKDLWCFLGTGLASVVFFNFCYFSCIQRAALSTAAILLYTAPSFLMILSAFLFKERFTLVKVLCLVLTFAGCVLVSGGFGEMISPSALLLGLGAGFGYALYSVFSRYAIEKGYSSFTITTYTFLFAMVGCLPFVNPVHFAGCLTESGVWVPVFILLTVLTTVAAYLLYTAGLSGMENSVAGILASVEPVVATLIGVFIFRESLSLWSFAGIVLVLSSCVLVSLCGRKKSENESVQNDTK